MAIGKAIAGRYFFKDVDPGTHEISVRAEVARRLAVKISTGEFCYVRVSPRLGWLIGRFATESVSPETAEGEIRDLVLLQDRTTAAGR